MAACEQFRHWFDYEKQSHALVMAAFAAAPPAARTEPGFQKALDLLAHTIAARRLWLHRFGALPEGPGDIFPAGVPLIDLAERLAAMERPWADYLARLDDAELERVFRYHALDGRAFENSVREVLTQLFGHSWYHRGQIALLMRGCGATPAITDYVFTARRAV